MQGKINRGRHTDRPAGRHSIQTNQYPLSLSPPIFLQAGYPSCRPTNSVKALKATRSGLNPHYFSWLFLQYHFNCNTPSSKPTCFTNIYLSHHRFPSDSRTDSADFMTGPFWASLFFVITVVFFITLSVILVPCGRLSWQLIGFWVHKNVVYHIVSYRIMNLLKFFIPLFVSVGLLKTWDEFLKFWEGPSYKEQLVSFGVVCFQVSHKNDLLQTPESQLVITASWTRSSIITGRPRETISVEILSTAVQVNEKLHLQRLIIGEWYWRSLGHSEVIDIGAYHFLFVFHYNMSLSCTISKILSLILLKRTGIAWPWTHPLCGAICYT